MEAEEAAKTEVVAEALEEAEVGEAVKDDRHPTFQMWR
jgi:hypothetical protein